MACAAPAGAGDDPPPLRVDFTVAPAAGGVIERAGLKLAYTLAEPVAGPVSTGGTRVIAGFQALFPEARPASIFDDGFEAASP